MNHLGLGCVASLSLLSLALPSQAQLPPASPPTPTFAPAPLEGPYVEATPTFQGPTTTPTTTATPTSTPAATASPTLGAVSYVFITSLGYQGFEIRGVTGADRICRKHARTAGLSGRFRAWISSDKRSARSRLTHSTVPYVLTDKTTVIARDWSDLVDGSLFSHIYLDEFGTDVTGGDTRVWTGTDTDGSVFPGQHCNNWRDELAVGVLGNLLASAGIKWTRWGNDTCERKARLYCFQQ